MEEGAQLVSELKERLQQYEEDLENKQSVSPCFVSTDLRIDQLVIT